MYRTLLSLLIISIFSIPNYINAKQLILQQIEVVKNYNLVKLNFDYTYGDFYLKEFDSIYILTEKINDLKSTVQSLFNSDNTLIESSYIENYTLIDDEIILKKFLILDTDYQIVNSGNNYFYRFKVYSPKREDEKRNFLKNIINQFRIEYGLR